MVLLGYIGVGIAVTWPHATYFTGRLPATRDAGSYVWGFWWMAHSVVHLSDPWHTTYLAAPVGADLGMHALMPLAGLILTPVTLAFGPSASYTLLSVILPGLLAYAMYRVARLWMPSQVGAIAAGAFFGYSAIIDFQAWVHLNLAAGALFLPMTLEAAARLRRRPGPGQAVVLGIVLGASLLVDQESAVLALIIAMLAIGPWLLPTLVRKSRETVPSPSGTPPDPVPLSGGPLARLRLARPFARLRPARPLARLRLARLRPKERPRFKVHWLRLVLAAVVAVTAIAIAAPQIVAIIHADAAGSPSATLNASSYLEGIKLPDMFLASPRVSSFGLHIGHAENASTFGLLPSLLALIGLVLAWRRRSAWRLAALWLAAAVLALGADLLLPGGTATPVAQVWDGVRVSLVLPYTWFIRIPGLIGFREPSRIAELGLLSIALLAGYTVNWLRYHARHLIVVVLVLGVFEAGLTTPPQRASHHAHHAARPRSADRGRPFRLGRGGHTIRPARRHRRHRHAVRLRDAGARHRRPPPAGRRPALPGADRDGHRHRQRALLPRPDQRPDRPPQLHARAVFRRRHQRQAHARRLGPALDTQQAPAPLPGHDRLQLRLPHPKRLSLAPGHLLE